jgi:DNA-binding response OmpR family regulator
MPSDTLSRVLCVDDDEDAGEMLSLLLKSHRIEVTCARSAAEAWLKIKTERFDLYMLDGWLPHLDGFEFCRQIRAFDAVTPILFYSGAAYDVDKAKGMAAGANAYVTKPDIEGLIETIVGLIAKAKAEPVAAGWAGKQPRPVVKAFSVSLSFSAETVCD